MAPLGDVRAVAVMTYALRVGSRMWDAVLDMSDPAANPAIWVCARRGRMVWSTPGAGAAPYLDVTVGLVLLDAPSTVPRTSGGLSVGTAGSWQWSTM
jgi:hypothetical protein